MIAFIISHPLLSAFTGFMWLVVIWLMILGERKLISMRRDWRFESRWRGPLK